MTGELDVTTVDADLDLSLHAAVKDSPNFRASVAMLEDEIDSIERWLDHLCRTIRVYIEYMSKVNDESVALAKKTMPSLGEEILDPDMSMQALHIFADCLQTTHAFRAKLASDLDGNLLQPLTNLIRDDFRELKEARRANEKAQDKYESALARYATVHKAKEASALREDAFQLYEVRKAYVRASMDYTLKVVKFRECFEHLLVEQFLAMSTAQLEHYELSYQVYKSVGTQLQQLQYKLSESRATYEYKLGKLQKIKKALEDEAIHSARPNTLLQAYFPSPGQPSYYNPNISNVLPSIDDNNPEKEGYLFKRSASKTPLAPDTWTRRWFWLRDGKFGYSTTSSTGKLRGHVASCTPLRTLLCEARPRTTEVGDRRFCFEVVSSRRSFVLQAETEEEMNEWLAAFAKSKQKEMASTSSEVIASMAYNSLPPATMPFAGNLPRAPAPPRLRNSAQPETLPAPPAGAATLETSQQPPTTGASSVRPPNSVGSEISDVSASSTVCSEGLRLSDFGESDTCHLVVADDPTFPRVPEVPVGKLPVDAANDPSRSQNAAGANEPLDIGGQPLRTNVTTSSGVSKDILQPSGRTTTAVGAAQNGSGASTTIGAGQMEVTALNPDSADVPQWKRYALESDFPSNLIKRNEEIRPLLKSLSSSDCVLDVFHCVLEGQKACLRGRAYVTQSNVCFYSSVLSLVTSFIIPFVEIEKISLEKHRLYSTVRIMEIGATASLPQTPETNAIVKAPPKDNAPTSPVQPARTISLKLFTPHDRKHFQILFLAWKNGVASLDEKKSVPQLYKYLMEEGRRVESPSGGRLDAKSDDEESEVDAVDGELTEESERGDDEVDDEIVMNTSPEAEAAFRRRQQSRARFADEEGKNIADVRSKSASTVRLENDSGCSSGGGVLSGSVGNDEPPPYVAIPPTPISCACSDHLEEKKLDIVLPIPVVRLWNIMFGDSSAADAYGLKGIWAQVYKRSNNIIQSAMPWTTAQTCEAAAAGITDVSDNFQKRTDVFTLQVNNPMAKVKETDCFETLFCLRKDEYRCYTVVSTTKAPALPYSDAFSPQIKYCLMHEGPGKSRLTAHIGIKWHKNPMVKGMIRSAAMKGMGETVANLAMTLQEHVQKPSAPVKQGLKRGAKSESALKKAKASPAIRRGKSEISNKLSRSTTGAPVEASAPARKHATTLRQRLAQGPGLRFGWLDYRSLIIAIICCFLFWITLRAVRAGVGSFTFGWRRDRCLVPDTLANMEFELLRRLPDIHTGFQDSPAEGHTADHSRLSTAPGAEQNGNIKVVWRAVYLKDLEEGLLNKSSLEKLGAQQSSPIFDRFLRSRVAMHEAIPTGARAAMTSGSSSDLPSSPVPLPSADVEDAHRDNYRWFLYQHYHVSQDLFRRRERIAIMRHEIIATFHELNSIDQRLILAEYLNWVTDETFHCETVVKLRKGDLKFDSPTASLAADERRYGEAYCANLQNVLRSLKSKAT